MTSELSRTIHTEDSEVKSSGRLVTAASMTPPMNAPEILLLASMMSTYLPSLKDSSTTTITVTAYPIYTSVSGMLMYALLDRCYFPSVSTLPP